MTLEVETWRGSAGVHCGDLRHHDPHRIGGWCNGTPPALRPGRIRPCVPNIIEIASGELMAVTPKDHPYRIGVFGSTEDEARRRFECAFQAWQELHDRASSVDVQGPGDE